MQSMGKMMRSTPPPHGAHGPHAHSNLAPRHQPVGGGKSLSLLVLFTVPLDRHVRFFTGGGGGGGGGGAYHGGNNYEGGNGGPGVHHGGGYQPQRFQGTTQRGGGASPYYNRTQGGPPGGYNSSRNNSGPMSDNPRLANGDDQQRKVTRESSYDSSNKTGHAGMSSLQQRDHGHKDQRKGYAG